MPRILSLFDGTGSISNIFLESGWEVQSLDIISKFGATIVCDIMKWDYTTEPPFDILFAGVPCENYSIANTRGKRNLILADSLVKKTWEIIKHFEQLHPTSSMIWFIENPDSSLLWRRRVSEPFPFYIRVDFCQYGKLYRKRTKIATNAYDYEPRALCNPKTCDSCISGKHIKSAQRGPCAGKLNDTCSLDELHSYPKELCEEIFNHCQKQQWLLI